MWWWLSQLYCVSSSSSDSSSDWVLISPHSKISFTSAVEKNPSMSDLNETLLGQEHFKQNDLSFVFRLQCFTNERCFSLSTALTMYVCVLIIKTITSSPLEFSSVYWNNNQFIVQFLRRLRFIEMSFKFRFETHKLHSIYGLIVVLKHLDFCRMFSVIHQDVWEKLKRVLIDCEGCVGEA